jgi:beta-xylosidase
MQCRWKHALILGLAGAILATLPVCAQSPSPASVSRVWNPDLGNGDYKNPVLFADYSDPDAIRVGHDFYMVASSFDAVPGLPILHSTDLVHWELIGHALRRQPPYEVYSRTQHGAGVWAPSIRQHNGEFYIFYPDPDYGIYMIKASSITGPWSEPLLIKAAKGWIDPCPLWDDDGNAYLISAMAASRSGVKNSLILSRMAADGTKLLDEGALIIDGHQQGETLEGPKLYKRNGYYYVFAPGGGVAPGYQLVYLSKEIYGPYERRTVLAQGKTAINGPHQGAWVDTAAGEDWFLHFQDRGPYGRVVWLEPMSWGADGWPRMGVNINAAGVGEPALTGRLPRTAAPGPAVTPADSDEFNGRELGLQWQWQANPQPNAAFPSPATGSLRLINLPAEVSGADGVNLWNLPHVLMQKFPAQAFTLTTKVHFTPRFPGDETGLVVMGQSYAALAVVNTGQGIQVVQRTRLRAFEGGEEADSRSVPVNGADIWLRAAVSAEATANFFWSADGANFQPIGSQFRISAGRWIGAKIGIYALGAANTGELGYADYDWFRFER